MDDENSKSEMYPTIKEEQCLHCKEFVQVELFPNGDGHAGVCPKCGELAYLGK